MSDAVEADGGEERVEICGMMAVGGAASVGNGAEEVSDCD